MRQDIGEFVTVYLQESENPVVMKFSRPGDDGVVWNHWLSIEDARKLAEELTRAADACRVVCRFCAGSGVCCCPDCQDGGTHIEDHIPNPDPLGWQRVEVHGKFLAECLICHGTGKVDP